MRIVVLIAWGAVLACFVWGSREIAKLIYDLFKITAVLGLIIVAIAAFSTPKKLWLLIDAGLVGSMFIFWFIVSAATM